MSLSAFSLSEPAIAGWLNPKNGMCRNCHGIRLQCRIVDATPTYQRALVSWARQLTETAAFQMVRHGPWSHPLPLKCTGHWMHSRLVDFVARVLGGRNRARTMLHRKSPEWVESGLLKDAVNFTSNGCSARRMLFV